MKGIQGPSPHHRYGDKEFVPYITAQKNRRSSYHKRRTRFISHRLITYRGRVDASEAERENNCGACLFFIIASAACTDSPAFSHSSPSCSRVITSGGASSGRPWPSATTQNKSFSSRVFNPEIIFRSTDRALSYVTLNFRGPAQLLSMITINQKVSTSTRTDLGN